MLNHYHSKFLGVWKHALNIVTTIFQITVLIFICVYWVFPNEPDLDAPDDGTSAAAKPKRESVWEKGETNQDWQNLIFWL